MVCQIYSAVSAKEAIALADAGVYHIGVSPATDSELIGELSNAQLHEMVLAVGDKAKIIALFIDNTFEETLRITKEVGPAIIHLCGDEYNLTPEFVRQVKEECPGVEVMQAIPVTGPEAVDIAIAYSEYCDYLILDSVTTDMPGIGAAGVTHDWNISKEICERAKCRVVLAGGLGPDNVAQAIKFVRPWGVDSLTKTNKTLADGSRIKDIDKVRAFCENAQRAAKEAGLC